MSIQLEYMPKKIVFEIRMLVYNFRLNANNLFGTNLAQNTIKFGKTCNFNHLTVKQTLCLNSMA